MVYVRPKEEIAFTLQDQLGGTQREKNKFKTQVRRLKRDLSYKKRINIEKKCIKPTITR